MKLSALLLLAVLVIAAAVAHGLELDTKGTHLRQLQEQPKDQPQPEQNDYPDDDDNGDATDGDDDYEMAENGRCFPGSWNWPRCRYGGGGCFPGSWNWPRCRYGGGGCSPGSWDWPRCRHKKW